MRPNTVIGSFAQEPTTVEEPRSWPMSSAQLRIWFVEQLAGGSAIHNLFFGVQLTGELNIAALDLSLKTICDRHEALGTTFAMHDGQSTQLVGQAQPPGLSLIDLGAYP